IRAESRQKPSDQYATLVLISAIFFSISDTLFPITPATIAFSAAPRAKKRSQRSPSTTLLTGA
ncbi:hypothetical protein LTR28_002694, partial [Elasticomyces elasticus]